MKEGNYLGAKSPSTYLSAFPTSADIKEEPSLRAGRKSIPGRRNSLCKGPETGKNTVCWRERKACEAGAG